MSLAPLPHWTPPTQPEWRLVSRTVTPTCTRDTPVEAFNASSSCQFPMSVLVSNLLNALALGCSSADILAFVMMSAASTTVSCEVLLHVAACGSASRRMRLFDQFRRAQEEDSDEEHASPAPSSASKTTPARAVPCKRKGKLALFDLTVSSGARPPRALARLVRPHRGAGPLKHGEPARSDSRQRCRRLQTARIWCHLHSPARSTLRSSCLQPTHHPPTSSLPSRHLQRIYTPASQRLAASDLTETLQRAEFADRLIDDSSCDTDDEPEAPVAGRTGAQKASNAFDIKVRTKG